MCAAIIHRFIVLPQYLLIEFTSLQIEKKIPVCYFPPDSKITSDHAAVELGRLGIQQPTQQAIDDMISKIFKARYSVQSWSRTQIQQMMYQEAKEQNLTCGRFKRSVQSYKDILESYKEDGSVDHVKKIWEVAFGGFDRNKGWAKDLADTFMSRHGWEYELVNIPPNKRTYCVEQTIAKVKVELIKRLNAAVLKTHKNTIGISRDAKNITKETKFEKRKKAVFQPHFIVSHVSPILIRADLLFCTLTTIILVRNMYIG